MTQDEIKAKLQAVAAGIVAESATPKDEAEKAANDEVVQASYEAGFDLAAFALHTLGRIADALEKANIRTGDTDAGNG